MSETASENGYDITASDKKSENVNTEVMSQRKLSILKE